MVILEFFHKEAVHGSQLTFFITSPLPLTSRHPGKIKTQHCYIGNTLAILILSAFKNSIIPRVHYYGLLVILITISCALYKQLSLGDKLHVPAGVKVGVLELIRQPWSGDHFKLSGLHYDKANYVKWSGSCGPCTSIMKEFRNHYVDSWLQN